MPSFEDVVREVLNRFDRAAPRQILVQRSIFVKDIEHSFRHVRHRRQQEDRYCIQERRNDQIDGHSGRWAVLTRLWDHRVICLQRLVPDKKQGRLANGRSRRDQRRTALRRTSRRHRPDGFDRRDGDIVVVVHATILTKSGERSCDDDSDRSRRFRASSIGWISPAQENSTPTMS